MSWPVEISNVTQNDQTIYSRICNGNMKEGMECYNRDRWTVCYMSFNFHQQLEFINTVAALMD